LTNGKAGEDLSYPETRAAVPIAPETLRFGPANQGFRQRTEVVNSIIERWPIVCGTGSLLEAHLVGRLALAGELPSLVGCAINEVEVWQLCQTLEQPGLVILSESVAVDRGMALIQRLQRERLGHRVLLLVQAPQHVPIQALIQFLHQGAPLAMVHVESFGTGVDIRALLALRAGSGVPWSGVTQGDQPRRSRG